MLTPTEILDRLKAHPKGAPLDWTSIREELHDAHERSTSDGDRALCIALFFLVMDQVERGLEKAPTDAAALENFREARRKDYSLFIVREALIGEHVSPDLLDYVTKREVAAGRMKPDHPLREAAEKGLAEEHSSPAEMLAQHQAKMGGALRAVPTTADPPRFNPSQGLLRLAAVIRWLGYGAAGLLVVAGLAGLVFMGGEGPGILLTAALAGVVIAGAGWAIAWIVEGFAGTRG